MDSVVTVTLSAGRVWLHLNDASLYIRTCRPFREWLTREFGDRVSLARVWNAIRVPGWLVYSAADTGCFGVECLGLAREIDYSFGPGGLDWRDTTEQPDVCDAIREALPSELMEAFFAETLAS